MSEEQAMTETAWFYEVKGQRKGPITESDMIQLIKSSNIAYGSSIWRQGYPDWLKVENSVLRIHLDNTTPPPLAGDKINNTFIWILAFAPLIGYFLEWVVAGAMYGDNELAADVAMANNQYWFVTLALNIGLAYLDEMQLKNAGHNTDNFKGWVWLIPVYLYQRANATKQNLAYFIVWIVCFALVLF